MSFESEKFRFLAYVQFKNISNRNPPAPVIMNSAGKRIGKDWFNQTYEVLYVHSGLFKNKTSEIVFSANGSLYFFGSPHYFPFDMYYLPLSIDPLIAHNITKDSIQVSLSIEIAEYSAELLNVEVTNGSINFSVALRRNVAVSPINYMIMLLFLLWGCSFLIDPIEGFSTRVRLYIATFVFLFSFNLAVGSATSHMSISYCLGSILLNFLTLGIVLSILVSSLIKIISKYSSSFLEKYPIRGFSDLALLVFVGFFYFSVVHDWNSINHHFFPSSSPNLFPLRLVASPMILPISLLMFNFIINFSLRKIFGDQKKQLIVIRGIGLKRNKQLKALKIRTLKDLASASPEDLASKLNLSSRIISKWIRDAKELVEQ